MNSWMYNLAFVCKEWGIQQIFKKNRLLRTQILAQHNSSCLESTFMRSVWLGWTYHNIFQEQKLKNKPGGRCRRRWQIDNVMPGSWIRCALVSRFFVFRALGIFRKLFSQQCNFRLLVAYLLDLAKAQFLSLLRLFQFWNLCFFVLQNRLLQLFLSSLSSQATCCYLTDSGLLLYIRFSIMHNNAV